MIQSTKRIDVKQITTLAVLSTIAFIVMYFIRVPVVLFLKYEPKDVIIAIGGFIYGPLAAATISAVVSLVEMLLVSETGFIGMIMNILSSCAFACTAAFIYKKKQTLSGAVIGLVSGALLTTGIMVLWNYLLVPLYMNTSRAEVAALLIPAFLPFNLLKGGFNAAITMLLYKPVVGALRRAHLIPESQGGGHKRRFPLGVMLVAGLVLITCILLVLAMRGIL